VDRAASRGGSTRIRKLKPELDMRWYDVRKERALIAVQLSSYIWVISRHKLNDRGCDSIESPYRFSCYVIHRPGCQVY